MPKEHHNIRVLQRTARFAYVVPSRKSWNRSLDEFIKLHKEVQVMQGALDTGEEPVPRIAA